MVAPSTNRSNTSITAPIGPLDFFTGGGADFETLFLGTGGPLEGEPPPGSTELAAFFGENGDWVTLEADFTPFDGGAPFAVGGPCPMVLGIWIPVPLFAGTLDGGEPGEPFDGALPRGIPVFEGGRLLAGTLDGGVPGAFFSREIPGEPCERALDGGEAGASLTRGGADFAWIGALATGPGEVPLAGNVFPGGIFDGKLETCRPGAGEGIFLAGVPRDLLIGSFLEGSVLGALAGKPEGVLETAGEGLSPGSAVLAGSDFFAKGKADVAGTLDGNPPGSLAGSDFDGTPLVDRGTDFFIGSLDGTPDGDLEGNPTVFFTGRIDFEGTLDGRPDVLAGGAFDGTLEGGAPAALKGDAPPRVAFEGGEGSFFVPGGDGFFKLKAKDSSQANLGCSTGDVLMDQIPQVFGFDGVEVLPGGFQVLKGFTQCLGHSLMRLCAPSNNREIFSPSDPFVPVPTVQTDAQKMFLSFLGRGLKLAIHLKVAGVLASWPGKRTPPLRP
jgi:hypothetical protein